MASPSAGGLKALHRLKSTEPPLWLSPSTELSEAARIASQYLFQSLQPYCPKSPFDRLLVDGFDAEQIWQQLDLQTQPLLSNLRREIKRFERNPGEISKLITEEVVKEEAEGKTDANTEKKNGVFVEDNGDEQGTFEDFEDMEDEEIGISDEDDEGGEEEDEGEEEEEEEREQEEQGDRNGGSNGIEDRFLKIKELEEYLENDEAREYGLSKEKQRDDHKATNDNDKDDEERDDDDDDEEGEEEDDEVSLRNRMRIP